MTMKQDKTKTRFAICVRNDGYPASLELRKLYQIMNDESAASHQLLRVIDESGEDYLYPMDYFIEIKLPEAAEKVLAFAA